MKKRKLRKILSVCLIVILIGQFLINALNIQNANASTVYTTDITYVDGTSLWDNNVYSAKSQITGGISIDAGTGYVIEEAYYMEKGQKTPIPEAVDKPNWSGPKTISGDLVNVISSNNDSTKGVYTWDRYGVGDPHGVNWYEGGGIGSCPESPITQAVPGCSPSGSITYDNVNGTSMPHAPYVIDSGLGLDGTLNKPYLTTDTGIIIPDVAVAGPKPSDFHPTVNGVDSIKGPNGTIGRTYPYPTNLSVTNITDSTHFRVTFSQDFSDFKPTQVYDFQLPGAREISFFSAFYIDVNSVSYKYPKQVSYTVKPAPNAPNLGNIVLDEDNNCIQTGVSQSYHFSFTNSGVTAITQSFNVEVRMDGVLLQTIPYSGLAGGAKGTGTFTYTFNSSKTISISIDKLSIESDAAKDLDNVASFPITPQATCGPPPPGKEVVTAGFTIEKPSMPFGDSNTITSNNISVTGGNGCAIQEVAYTVSQSGNIFVYSASSAFSFSLGGFPVHPNWLTVGTVSVSLKVTSTCGGQATAGPKTFEIITPPSCTSSNSAPILTAGFVQHGNSAAQKPLDNAFVGDWLDLQIINDTLATPPTPYDPDGDPYTITWDWNTAAASDAWLKKLKDLYDPYVNDTRYSFGYSSTLTDADKGTHRIDVYATDLCGNTNKRTATINVIDKNPIPSITLPPKVIEKRPFSPDFSTANSYSPVPGRTIVSSDWHGTKLTTYPAYGDYPIKLDVTDNTGLVSSSPDTKTLHVLEDLPPKAEASYASVGVRNVAIPFKDTSYSPDGDILVEHTDTIVCDVNNNGTFSGDPITTITPDSQGRFSYTGTIVGNCNLHIHVKEDWGKSDDKDFPFTIANQQPDADVGIFGQQPQPPVITPVSYSIKDLLDTAKFNSFSLDKPNTLPYYLYDAGQDALVSPDMDQSSQGYGSIRHGFTPYKAPINNNVQVRTLFKMDDGSVYYDGSGYHLGNPFQDRLFKHTWLARDTNAGDYVFPSEDVNYSNVASVPNFITPKSGLYQDVVTKTNIEDGLYWVRVRPHTGYGYYWYQTSICRSYETFHDYVYHLSDLASGNTSPFYTANPTIYDTSCHAGTAMVDQPPPYVWVEPSPIKDVMTTSSGATVTHINDTKYTYRVKINSHMAYDSDGPYVVVDSANLQKTDLSGNVIWVSSHAAPSYQKVIPGTCAGGYCSYTTEYATDPIVISSDGSKVVTDGMEIYDTSSGVYLGKVPNAPFSMPVYPKILGDKILIDTQPSNNYVYDARTGQTVTLPKNGVFSGDFKYITASLSAIQVYDINSGSLLYTIPYTIPTSSYGSNATMLPPVLSEDGKVLLSLRSTAPYKDAYGYPVNWTTGISISTDAFAINPNPSSFDYGMLTDKSHTIQNGTISLSIKFYNDLFTDSTGAGIVFRQQDNRNMYRVEASTGTISLVKIVNGVKTVLGKASYPSDTRKYYNLLVKAKGSRLIVSYGGSQLISAIDSTFSSGYYGIYDELPNVYLKGLQANLYQDDSVQQANVVLVGTSATYNTTFTDPDNDPAIPALSKWTFTNLQPYKFLNAGDGYSEPSGQNSYVNYQTNSPMLSFNKVGVYKVDYQIPDDPAPPGFKYPNNLFASFRLYSDPVSHNVIVHRPPINFFTLNQNTDGTITWNEAGYDPDRWLSSVNYSTESPIYQTNHGIFNRVYNYTDPNGTIIQGKLVRPSIPGVYTVREAVSDEYGAWSDWFEQLITVVPAPNNPPSITLTFPNGTQANPSFVSSLTPTITWNQSDPDANTTFSLVHLIIKDESNATFLDKTIQQNTTSPNGQYALTTSLIAGMKYNVQVQVSDDGGLWSNWSNIGWMITNRPPTATMTVPGGTQADPTIFSSLRPTLQWSQTDPDPGTVFKAVQFQITNEANNLMILDSGQIAQNTTVTSGSWTVTSDLPAGQKLRVWVRVYDGYVWSSYSPQTWMYINRTPTANFDWNPKPVWEGDTVTFVNQSTDPDGDTMTYSWSIRRPDFGIFSTTQKQFSSLLGMAGNYEVTLLVSDGIASSSVTKIVTALPLTIQSDVTYTAHWLELHEQSGHNTTQRPRDFYSGEIFVVETRSSPTPVAEAKAWIDTTGIDGNTVYISKILLSSSDSTFFQGELFDPILQSMTEGLPTGPQTIHFQIRYTNGIIKTEDIPINIIGNVNKSVGVHRVQ